MTGHSWCFPPHPATTNSVQGRSLVDPESFIVPGQSTVIKSLVKKSRDANAVD
jgi:hypothetical protein